MSSQPKSYCAPHACLMRKAIVVICTCAGLLCCWLPGALADTAAPKAATCIAPLFMHGDGKALLTLEETDSPAFLSDAEAFEVIAEEARGNGIQFSVANRLLIIPGYRDGKQVSPARSVTLDGADTAKKISFAYISAADANAARRMVGPDKSIEDVDIRAYAESLRVRMADANPEGTVVVFYDPVVTISEVIPHLTDSEAATADLADQARQLARKELRRQVRDFLDWLAPKKTT